MPDQPAVIALYESHDRAEAAVRQLQQQGIDISGVSVIGGGSVEEAAGHYTRGGEVRHQGEHRGLWSFLSGLLADTGTFVIPGSGPVMVAGPAVGWLVEAVENVEGDGGRAIGRSLASSGIPADQRPEYEAAVHDGRWLVIVHGTPETLRQAKAVVDATLALRTATYG